MSYIQVEIGGKLRGLKFNQMALLILQEKMEPGNLISGVYGLVWGGLKANCYVKGEEVDFTFEQSCDWADELDESKLNEIRAAFQKTEAYKKGAAYLDKLEEAKKKEIPISNPLKSTG